MKAIQIVDKAPQLIDVAESGEGVRVRVTSSSICGSDLHLINLGFADGQILGHEFAGVTDNGTAVAVEPILGCGSCDACDDGRRTNCTTGAQFLGIGVQGGMAEFVTVPEVCIVPLPSGFDSANGCAVETTAVALHAVNRAQIRAGERVLVIGAGPIGLATAAVLADRGIACDVAARHDHQREAATRLGAGTDVGSGYDVVVEAVGSTAALTDATHACRPQGRIALVGTPWEAMTFDTSLAMKEVSIIPAATYSGKPPNREFDEAARIVHESDIANVIITHRFPLDGAAEAFAIAADRAAGAIKVAFDI